MTLLPKYNSRFRDPHTSGVDALGQNDWHQENNYVNPPFRMLARTIRHIISQKAEAPSDVHIGRQTIPHPTSVPVLDKPLHYRASKKQMEDNGLESAWCIKLHSLGWSHQSINIFLSRWAPSTRRQYNCYIRKFSLFCEKNNLSIDNVTDNIVADYITSLAGISPRPKSQAFGTLSALTAYYAASDICPITQEVCHLAEGLVKCSTNAPMCKTQVMPIRPFFNLFQSWDNDHALTLKCLRLKAICLLALYFMLRPSDVAPRSEILNASENSFAQTVFSENQIEFLPDGALSITFHGIKNDYDRDGFTVTLPALPPDLAKLDPRHNSPESCN
jgi:hypothetical protein